MDRERLYREYRDIALGYLEKPGENGLYKASLFSKQFMKSDLGPDEIVQLHFDVLDEVLGQCDNSRHRETTRKLSALLLEAIMAYSDTHKKVVDVLSELKKKYAELDESKSELEKSKDALKEKTAQLIQTEKMTALGELTAGVAHEINQPLNAIKIICDDMVRDIKKNRFDQGKLGESLRDVLGEVMRMAEIIDHMRIFTRRTEGEHREVFDANKPIEGVLKLLGQQLRIHGIEIVKDLNRGLFVVGNPVRLEQVIMNLITNARDAVKKNAKEKGMKIFIKTYLEAAEGGQEPFVVYEIDDNGTGIPEHLHQKIFEPFFTRKAPGEGTGLGLSVTMEIVTNHDGRIEVESQEGKGTTFRVLLPACTSVDRQ